MRRAKKREAEKRARLYLLLISAKIIAQFTMIIGFGIFVYLLLIK